MTCADDSRNDALFEDAVVWMARLREPDAGEAERRAFARWHDAAPAHAQAYAQAQALWHDLAAPAAAVLAHCPELPARPAEKIRFLEKREGVKRRPALPPWAAMAASALLLAAASVWVARGGWDDLRADHVTAVGEARTVALPDGSRVTLNTDTALAVDMTGGQRRLRLLRGEAFFEAAPDPARPFIVGSSGGEIRVIGTRFNLRAGAGGTVAAVEEGVVAAVPAASPSATLTLTAGQAARIEPSAARRLDGVEPADEAAWRRGQLVFYRTPLGEAVAALNRYHRGTILILDDDLRARPVTGVFDTARPVAAVDLIEAALGARSVRLGERVILLH